MPTFNSPAAARAVTASVAPLLSVWPLFSVAAAPASGEYGAQEAQSRQQCCNPLFHIQFSFFITARNESVCLPFQSRAAARRHC